MFDLAIIFNKGLKIIILRLFRVGRLVPGDAPATAKGFVNVYNGNEFSTLPGRNLCSREA